jgi:hypothetical protein
MDIWKISDFDLGFNQKLSFNRQEGAKTLKERSLYVVWAMAIGD